MKGKGKGQLTWYAEVVYLRQKFWFLRVLVHKLRDVHVQSLMIPRSKSTLREQRATRRHLYQQERLMRKPTRSRTSHKNQQQMATVGANEEKSQITVDEQQSGIPTH